MSVKLSATKKKSATKLSSVELWPITFGLAAVLAFIACPAGTEAQFINKMLKFCTNV